MAEAQLANGESDPDLIDDNAGENEPPAEPPPPKEKQEECPACEVGARHGWRLSRTWPLC